MQKTTSTTRRAHYGPLITLLMAALLAGGAIFLTACEDEDPEPEGFARAQQVTHRSQLIGGPTALGDVGDYMMENDKIRLVIQDKSFNRGSGLFGGSLIDADLVRHDDRATPFGGNGRDTFGELFPAYFLEVVDPEEIVVVNDGTNGEAAIIEVRGRGGEFVTMLRFFNHAMVNAYEASLGDLLGGEIPTSDGEPLVTFTARYILEPGASHVRVESEMVNESMASLTFPNRDIINALNAFLDDINLSNFTVPTGMVIGFGALNNLFVPGIGYDIRFGMEDLYEEPVELPAIPGHVVDMIATSSDRGISYGFASAPDADSNFVHNKQEFYGENNPDDLLFLFYASGFAGAFTSEVPRRLAPSFCDPERPAAEVCGELEANCLAELHEDASTASCTARATECEEEYDTCVDTRSEHPDRFTSANYLIIGSGDVASVRDELFRIRQQDTVTVTGRVFHEFDGQPTGELAQIFVYEGIEGAPDAASACAETDDDSPHLYSQAHTNSEGYFEMQLTPGQYCYRVRDDGPTSDLQPFEVGESTTRLEFFAPAPGRVEGFVVDQSGNPLPAKLTLVGEYEPQPGLDTRHFLFDLSVREHWRPSEFVSYDPDDTTPRRFIEDISFASADGRFSTRARPGTYTAYVSRGAEYELFEKTIEVKPGAVARFNAQIHRTVQADGYLSADLHLHAQGSIDSGLNYNDRVISVAAEGVEVAVASDHNYISDFMPYIHRNNLQPFLRSIIGLESTTFEAGHFNAFPLRQDIASMNRGSIKWQNVPPQQIFDDLRAIGTAGEDTIIQVNHPRDSLLGYFNQHYVDPLTGVAELPINTADPTDLSDTLFAAAASPNGPAFIREVDGEYESTFSYDFDAIEIYNGKRIHLLRHYRMPYDKVDMPQEVRDQLTEEQYDALPEQKGVILCDDDDVAYPGALDDWYNFLNYRRPDGTYKRYTITGNSDSHRAGGMGDPEPGFPKNYIWAGQNDPQKLHSDQLARALQDHHAIITNGPFFNMSINGEPIGSTVVTDSGEVTLDLYAEAASWVGVDRFTIVANGESVYEGVITLDDDGTWSESVTLPMDQDTWFVVEAEGDNNLFPVVQPAEIPQIAFDQVIGSLAGAFGFGGAIEGLSPTELTEIRPLVFTNPIWVVHDASGDGRTEFEPPEPPLARCVDGTMQSMEARSLHDFVPFGESRLDAQSVPLHLHEHSIIEREQGEFRDARLLFEHWGGHSH